MGRGKRNRAGRPFRPIGHTALAAATVVLAGAALAQDGSGLLLTFGIQSEFRYDDNPDLDDPSTGSSAVLDNRLSFGLTSETRSQTLRLRVSGNLPISDGTSTSTGDGLEKPRLTFSYQRRGSRSLFAADASYAQSDLSLLGPILVVDETGDGQDATDTDQTDPVDDGTTTDETIVIGADSATRIDRSVGFRFVTGIDEPLRFTLSARHSERDFNDTVDPDLFASTTDRLNLNLDLRFSQTLSAGLQASTQRYSAEDVDSTERRTDSVSLSLSYTINPTTRLSASLGQTRVATDKITGSSETDGFNGSVSLRKDLPVGSVGLSFARTVSASGGQNSVNLSRNFDMPSGRIDLGFGFTRSSDGTVSFVGRADLRRDLKRGQLNFGLTRSVGTDSDGDDVLSTRLSANAVYDLNQLSSVRFQMGYARVEDGGVGTVPTADQIDASLSLQRQLTPDWALTAGYKYRATHEQGAKHADSNAIFVSIGRQFKFRP